MLGPFESRWNMRLLLSLVFSLILIVLPVSSGSVTEQQAKRIYPVSIVGESLVVYPKTPSRPAFALRISQGVEVKNGWPEDNFVLEVLASRTASTPLARMNFHSTYGFFDLSLVDLTGDGVEEFVLVTGQGRGTNIREETLEVWKREGKSFKSLLEEKVSAPCGVSCNWTYEREFVLVDKNPISRLRLIRKTTGTIESWEHGEIPKEELLEYAYDATSGVMNRLR